MQPIKNNLEINTKFRHEVRRDLTVFPESKVTFTKAQNILTVFLTLLQRLNAEYGILPSMNQMIRNIKSNLADLTWPSVDRMLPYVVAATSGFFVSSLLCVGVAWLGLSMWEKASKQASANLAETEDSSVFQSTPARDYSKIATRDLFNFKGNDVKDPGAPVDPLSGMKKSSLPLKFTGIIFGGEAKFSLVVLESASNKQVETFVLGDQVAGDATIIDIWRNKVIFDRNGQKEFLDLEIPPDPIRKRKPGVKSEKKKVKSKEDLAASGDGVVIKEDGFEREGGVIKATKQWVERALTTDFSKTLQDAKASPNTVNGEVKGFVLSRIRDDSVYEKMGLKDGDIVESINGIELNDAARAIRTLEAMRNESGMELIVRRNGAPMSVKVQIK